MAAVVEIKSDTSLAEAVKILADNKILSAPVVDVDAPADASWMDRYLGVVEFAGIAVWILHQVSVPINFSLFLFMEANQISSALFIALEILGIK